MDTLQVIHTNRPADKASFLADQNAQDATLMRLQDIGEQLSRLRENFPEFYEKNHTDDWNKLIGLRNIISHGYREIDFETIWQIISEKLPPITQQMKELAKKL